MTCVLVAAGVVALQGCAGIQTPYDSQQKLTPEQQQLQTLQQQVAVLGRRVDAINKQQQGSGVSAQLRDLQGQMQELQHQVKQQHAAVLARLATRSTPPAGVGAALAGTTGLTYSPASGSSTAAGAVPAVPASATSAAGGLQPKAPASTSPASAGGGSEEVQYISNFNLLQSGKFDAAIKGFKSMLAQYPQGNYADNAWYWLGSAYYVKGDSKQALASFSSLVQKFPHSAKVPNALFKIGVIQQADGHADTARAVFKKIVDKFPASDVANQAKQRLNQSGN